MINGVQENESKIMNEEHEHSSLAKRSLLVDANGNAYGSSNPLPVNSNASAALKFEDVDEGATYTYYGFSDSGNAWQIKQLTNATGSIRYASGSSDYTTAWTNRALQTYGL